MATTIPGYTTEQKVITTTNDDASMNAAIDAEAPDQWLVSLLVPKDTDMVILFTRTIADAPAPLP